MVFLPTACIAPLVAGQPGLRRTDARKHVQPSARSIAVSHLRLIDRYIVRSHLQFDATDDDAPAVHYLVADTDVGRFCAGGSSTGLGAPAGCLQSPGSLGRDHSRRNVEGSGHRDTHATLLVAARPGRSLVHLERVALPKAGALKEVSIVTAESKKKTNASAHAPRFVVA